MVVNLPGKISDIQAKNLKLYQYAGRDDSLIYKYITNPIYIRIISIKINIKNRDIYYTFSC